MSEERGQDELASDIESTRRSLASMSVGSPSRDSVRSASEAREVNVPSLLHAPATPRTTETAAFLARFSRRGEEPESSPSHHLLGQSHGIKRPLSSQATASSRASSPSPPRSKEERMKAKRVIFGVNRPDGKPLKAKQAQLFEYIFDARQRQASASGSGLHIKKKSRTQEAFEIHRQLFPSDATWEAEEAQSSLQARSSGHIEDEDALPADLQEELLSFDHEPENRAGEDEGIERSDSGGSEPSYVDSIDIEDRSRFWLDDDHQMQDRAAEGAEEQLGLEDDEEGKWEDGDDDDDDDAAELERTLIRRTAPVVPSPAAAAAAAATPGPLSAPSTPSRGFAIGGVVGGLNYSPTHHHHQQSTRRLASSFPSPAALHRYYSTPPAQFRSSSPPPSVPNSEAVNAEEEMDMKVEEEDEDDDDSNMLTARLGLSAGRSLGRRRAQAPSPPSMTPIHEWRLKTGSSSTQLRPFSSAMNITPLRLPAASGSGSGSGSNNGNNRLQSAREVRGETQEGEEEEEEGEEEAEDDPFL